MSLFALYRQFEWMDGEINSEARNEQHFILPSAIFRFQFPREMKLSWNQSSGKATKDWKDWIRLTVISMISINKGASTFPQQLSIVFTLLKWILIYHQPCRSPSCQLWHNKPRGKKPWGAGGCEKSLARDYIKQKRLWVCAGKFMRFFFYVVCLFAVPRLLSLNWISQCVLRRRECGKVMRWIYTFNKILLTHLHNFSIQNRRTSNGAFLSQFRAHRSIIFLPFRHHTTRHDLQIAWQSFLLYFLHVVLTSSNPPFTLLNPFHPFRVPFLSSNWVTHEKWCCRYFHTLYSPSRRRRSDSDSPTGCSSRWEFSV